MRFTVCDADQRSPEWFTARCGRITGSRAKDILAQGRSKNEEAVTRRDYRLQLVCERLTGHPQEDAIFVNDAMRRGIEKEPEAFSAYEAVTGHMVQRSGFLASTTHLAGCSLDGHLDAFQGILEVKVPKSATHLRYLRENTIPKEHLAQVTHNLWITGADYCDFMSFDDRFPPELQVFLVRVEAKDVNLAEYEAKALTFLAEVERELASVQSLGKVMV